MTMLDVLYIFFWGLVSLVGLYIVARAIWTAYFNAKADFLRKWKGDDDHGSF